MLQKIRIKLKSYDHATLDQSASDIVRTARRTGAVTSGPVPLPTKKTVYTVLRSPHVDKKSREQFEIRIHKRLIDITRSTLADDGSAREAGYSGGRRHRDQDVGRETMIGLIGKKIGMTQVFGEKGEAVPGHGDRGRARAR